MKQDDVSIGKVYAVKVSGKVCPVRVNDVVMVGADGRRRWVCTNLATKREVYVRGAVRFRYEVQRNLENPERYDRV